MNDTIAQTFPWDGLQAGDVIVCVKANTRCFTEGKEYEVGRDGRNLIIKYDDGCRCTNSSSLFVLKYTAYDSRKWADLSRVEKGEVLLSLREGVEYEFSTDGITWNKLYVIMAPRDNEYVRKKRKVHRPWELSRADGTTKVHLGSVKHERVDLPNTKQFAYRILEQ